MTDSLLTLSDVVIGYGHKRIAGPFNFTVDRGELVALIGKNGSGKSTLFRTLEGNLSLLKGEILFKGKPLKALSRARRGKEISIVTTEPISAGGLRVDELVALGRVAYTGINGRLSAVDKESVEEGMRSTGVTDLRDRFVSSLSDGERQKCMIARALAQDASLILLDEPFSFLDVVARLELQLFLRQRAKEKQTAIFYSTHDISQALRTAERLVLIDSDGQVEIGTPNDLINSGALERVFCSPQVRFDATLCDFVDNRTRIG